MGNSTLAIVLGTGFVAYVAIFGLFSKKKLPKSWYGPLAKIYFWPMLPFTYCIHTAKKYYEEIPGTPVVLGAVPMWGHPKKLHEKGVRGIINMMAESRGPCWGTFQDLGWNRLYLPTVDHIEPSVSDLEKAIAFIEHVSLSPDSSCNKTYVHCKGGHGRSAAVAICWLLYANKSENMTPREAQSILDAGKRKVRKHLYKQPNVLEFYRRLKQNETWGDVSESTSSEFIGQDARQPLINS